MPGGLSGILLKSDEGIDGIAIEESQKSGPPGLVHQMPDVPEMPEAVDKQAETTLKNECSPDSSGTS